MTFSHMCKYVVVLIIILYSRKAHGQMQNSDGLLGTIKQQGELLTSLKEKVDELTRTVNEFRIKAKGQEKTIKELSIKIESQNSEIQVLHNIINNMKEYPIFNSMNSPAIEVDNKRNGWSIANVLISSEWQKTQYHQNENSKGPSSRELRLLSQSFPDNDLHNQCAFYSYMSTDEHTLAPHHTLIFDVVKTNIGDSYNKYTGVFTVPANGLYVITWNIYSDAHSYAFSNLIINQNIWNSALANSYDNGDRHASTGIVVAHLNKDDVVFVKTHETVSGVGNIESSSDARSTFSGWRLN
ncbi:caprin-2-like [Saccostrea cucullata]|uniref:caprin-2-like n=1 Tax=Saccostrea cuccullata TaxID=36930 RepID=UPI002ED24143